MAFEARNHCQGSYAESKADILQCVPHAFLSSLQIS